MSVMEQNQVFYKQAFLGVSMTFKKKLEKGMEDAFMMNSALNDWNELSEEDRNRRTDYFRTNADPSWLCAPAWADYQENLKVGDGAYKISKAYNEETYKNMTDFYQHQHKDISRVIITTEMAREFKGKEKILRGKDKKNKANIRWNCSLPDEITIVGDTGKVGIMDMIYVRENIVIAEEYMRFCREHLTILEILTNEDLLGWGSKECWNEKMDLLIGESSWFSEAHGLPNGW